MPRSAPLLACPHTVDAVRLRELLLQALEAEHGHVAVLSAALRCALNDDLRRKWRDLLEHSRRRERTLILVFQQLDLNPCSQTPGRRIAGHLTAALLDALARTLDSGDPEAAQVVAAECVEHAAIRIQRTWDLIGHVARTSVDDAGRTLDTAFESAPRDEGELYRNRSWVRELWIETLGLPAVVPPPGQAARLPDTDIPRLPWRSRERMQP
jgi:hypothetical protein